MVNILKIKNDFIIFTIVLSLTMPIFGQNQLEVISDEIILVNSCCSFWPKLSDNELKYVFSKNGDTLSINVFAKFSPSINRHSDTSYISGYTVTTTKVQKVKIPKEMANKINVVIIIETDSLSIIPIEVFCFFNKEKKKNIYKINYRNQDTKNINYEMTLPKYKFRCWINSIFF